MHADGAGTCPVCVHCFIPRSKGPDSRGEKEMGGTTWPLTSLSVQPRAPGAVHE